MPRASSCSPHPARPGRAHRVVSWEDFRTALRYGGGGDLIVAVPAIAQKRAEHPRLGAPVGPHAELPRGNGYFREYERGTIVWTARHGATCLHGMVRDIWVLLGGWGGRLGLPTADVETPAGSDVAGAEFEGGRIAWSAAGGPLVSFA